MPKNCIIKIALRFRNTNYESTNMNRTVRCVGQGISFSFSRLFFFTLFFLEDKSSFSSRPHFLLSCLTFFFFPPFSSLYFSLHVSRGIHYDLSAFCRLKNNKLFCYSRLCTLWSFFSYSLLKKTSFILFSLINVWNKVF